MPDSRSFFKELFSNPVFLSAFFSWLSSQFIKMLIFLLRGRHRKVRDVLAMLFWKTGKMPSSHSALVVSLVTSIGIKNGFASDLFVFSCCFALVVIRDAVGVRRSSGVQAVAINRIVASLKEKEIAEIPPVKIIYGHTYIEVLVGALLGFAVALLFNFR